MITHADYDVLGCFADGNFDWWDGTVFASVFLDGGLDAVSKELANNIFEVGEDVGECGVEVPGELDFWEDGAGWVGGGGEGGYGFADAGGDFSGGAFEKYFADKVCGWCGGGGGEMPWGVECFGQSQVLLCYYAT